LAFLRPSPVVADKRAVLELDALDWLWRPAQVAASFDNAGDGCREGPAKMLLGRTSLRHEAGRLP
jgi:aspartate carbamoyltransferase catalytic subunit